jgi:hypothetical protein
VILVVLVFAVSLAAPFLAGLQNVIGLLIIGFALWEAWKINKRAKVSFAGPYSLAGTPRAGMMPPPSQPQPPQSWPTGGPGMA